ncbi:hypothetical protein CA13_58800 [Planctomycetes bacterium CA13]|uniref:Leucine Rich repeats (2 copies) n=1 Tax=Novipirellula herctigrandis TaxID=2527986 RepID=A0A5C5ZAQ2_9BACT|nr:hypothetical protein CA13_58800 [Planctomycetes bacterium CA13]
MKLRYSSRFLLALTAICALLLMWCANAWTLRHSVDDIRSNGGEVTFDRDGGMIRKLCSDLFGPHAAYPVQRIEVRGIHLSPEVLADISQLNSVRRLSIKGARIDNFTLLLICGLGSLKELWFENCVFDKCSAEDITLPRSLTTLRFQSVDIGDRCIVRLCSASKVAELSLKGTNFSIDGLNSLNMPSLTRLSIVATNVQTLPDFGVVEHLPKLSILLIDSNRYPSEVIDRFESKTGINVVETN